MKQLQRKPKQKPQSTNFPLVLVTWREISRVCSVLRNNEVTVREMHFHSEWLAFIWTFSLQLHNKCLATYAGTVLPGKEASE